MARVVIDEARAATRTVTFGEVGRLAAASFRRDRCAVAQIVPEWAPSGPTP